MTRGVGRRRVEVGAAREKSGKCVEKKCGQARTRKSVIAQVVAHCAKAQHVPWGKKRGVSLGLDDFVQREGVSRFD
jgi:hypothetical protein